MGHGGANSPGILLSIRALARLAKRARENLAAWGKLQVGSVGSSRDWKEARILPASLQWKHACPFHRDGRVHSSAHFDSPHPDTCVLFDGIPVIGDVHSREDCRSALKMVRDGRRAACCAVQCSLCDGVWPAGVGWTVVFCFSPLSSTTAKNTERILPTRPRGVHKPRSAQLAVDGMRNGRP